MFKNFVSRWSSARHIENQDKFRPCFRPRIDLLEDRLVPVVGVYDVPYTVDYGATFNGADLSGVVDVNESCTGGLIARGGVVIGSRHVLTAAHCMNNKGPQTQDATVLFYLRRGTASDDDGDIRQIAIAGKITRIKSYNSQKQFDDVAVITLDALAPYGAQPYEIYRGTAEQNLPMIISGYGSAGAGLDGEVDRGIQMVRISASGGQFFFTFNGVQGATALAFNANAAAIAAALQADFPSLGKLDVSVFPSGPHAGGFQVLFRSDSTAGVDGNPARLGFVADPSNPLVGSVAVTALVRAYGEPPEFQRLRVTAEAGSFQLVVNGHATAPIAFDADSLTIQNRLEAIVDGTGARPILQASVRLVPAGLPGAGSFEISFDRVAGDANIPQMKAVITGLTGTVEIHTIQNGGKRAKRMAQNVIDSQFDEKSFTITLDESDPTRGIAGGGDSGGPGLITIGGQTYMVGDVCCGGELIGASTLYPRATLYQKFIDGQTNKPNYTFTLDMTKQVAGDDDMADTIVAEVLAGNLVVRVNGTIYYQDKVAKVKNIVLKGSSDSETFTIAPSLSRFVTVSGGEGLNQYIVSLPAGGTRTVTIVGSEEGTDQLTVNGTDQKETFLVRATKVLRGKQHIAYDHMDSVAVRAGDGNDVITVTSTSFPDGRKATQVTADGEAGNDTINVGSSAGADPKHRGDLDRIRALVTAIGGQGTDLLFVSDQANHGNVNFAVSATQVVNGTATTRAFAGISYDGTTEKLRLKVGAGNHTFEVAPSLATEYDLFGRGAASDTLALDFTGTTGASLDPLGPGSGVWTFSSGHQPVRFHGMTSS